MLDDFALAAPLMRRITEHLDAHRIVGTAVEVGTPYYQGVSVAALVHAPPGRPAALVRQRAVDALTRFVHPLTGGADGVGWPFDADLNAAAIAQLLEAVEGVEPGRRGAALRVRPAHRAAHRRRPRRHPAGPALAVPVRPHRVVVRG